LDLHQTLQFNFERLDRRADSSRLARLGLDRVDDALERAAKLSGVAATSEQLPAPVSD